MHFVNQSTIRRKLILTLAILTLFFARATAQATDPLFIANNGNVGIGTVTPNAQLEVNGTVKFVGGNFFTVNDKFIIAANGNVGIGQRIPSVPLEVNGDVKITGTSSILQLDGKLGIGTPSFSTGEVLALKQNGLKFGIYPGYLDDAVNNQWTTLEMPGVMGLRVRDNLSTEGSVEVGSLKGTGKRPVFVDANGKLLAGGKAFAYGSTDEETGMTNSKAGWRTAGVASSAIDLEVGDVVFISTSFKFKWNFGTGIDEPKFGVQVTGCTNTTIKDSKYHQLADDWPRNQYQCLAFNYVYTATCAGNHYFYIAVDNNSNSDDPSTTSDHRILVTKVGR